MTGNRNPNICLTCSTKLSILADVNAAARDDLVEQARRMGLDPIIACSIVDVGMNPYEMDG